MGMSVNKIKSFGMYITSIIQVRLCVQEVLTNTPKGIMDHPLQIEMYRQKISHTRNHCSKCSYVHPVRITVATVPDA